MDWQEPAEDHPVWCAAADNKTGVLTAQSVSCTTKDPTENPAVLASMTPLALLRPAVMTTGSATAAEPDLSAATLEVQKFTSQDALGHFLLVHYKIRTPKDLTSCEVCHR
jgi:hypothetical protein